RLAHDVGALAAVVARPAHGDVTGFVELSLPPLAARDAPRVVEVEGPLVRLALLHVACEPATDFALEGVLLGRIAEVHRRPLPRSLHRRQKRSAPRRVRHAEPRTASGRGAPAAAAAPRPPGRWDTTPRGPSRRGTPHPPT